MVAAADRADWYHTLARRRSLEEGNADVYKRQADGDAPENHRKFSGFPALAGGNYLAIGQTPKDGNKEQSLYNHFQSIQTNLQSLQISEPTTPTITIHTNMITKDTCRTLESLLEALPSSKRCV